MLLCHPVFASTFEAEQMQVVNSAVGRFPTYIVFYDSATVSFHLEEPVINATVRVYAKEAFAQMPDGSDSHALMAITGTGFNHIIKINTEYWNLFNVNVGMMDGGDYSITFMNDIFIDSLNLDSNLYLDYVEIMGDTYIQPGYENSVRDYFLYLDTTRVKLSWDRNAEDDIDHYRVYRFLNDSVKTYNALDTIYIDSPIDTGKQYLYGVTAIDEAGNESDLSDLISAVMVNPIKADYDRSLVVDFADLMLFSQAWKKHDLHYDLDGVSPVTFTDLMLFSEYWKKKVEHPILINNDKLIILKEQVQ